MPNWISRLKGAAGLDLPEGVSQDWARRLIEALAPAGAPAGDIRRYILHGEPRSVLQASQGQLAAAVGLIGFKTEAASAIYRDFDGVPVQVRLRWAKFLEAAAGTTYPYYLPLPGAVHWPEILMTHAGSYGPGAYGNSQKIVGLSARGLGEMLAADGLEPHAVLVASFATPGTTSYMISQRLKLICGVSDYAEALDRHAGNLKPVAGTGDLAQRLHVLELLERANPPALTVLVDELAEMAVSSSKQVRVKATRLIEKVPASAIAPLKKQAAGGKPEQRANALRLLYEMGEEPFARSAAGEDKAASVRQLVDEWNAANSLHSRQVPALDYLLPVIDWKTELTPGLNKMIDDLFRGLNADVAQRNEWSKAHGKRYGGWAGTRLEPISDAELQTLKRYLTSGRPGGTEKLSTGAGTLLDYKRATVLGSHPGVTPALLFKIFDYLGLATMWGSRGLHDSLIRALEVLHERTGRPDLLELDQMFHESGVEPEALFLTYCNTYLPLAKTWDPEAVWPYFAHRLGMLTAALRQNPVDGYWFDRSAVLRAAALLPHLPEDLVGLFFELALGPGKSDRPGAQSVLASLPGYEERIVIALSHGKAEIRANAARWLGRIRYSPAVPALEKALAGEKIDLAKGVLLEALEQLGQPVEKYLDRAALEGEAAKVLAKPLPKDLEWFPWGSISEVRWSDTGAPVDPEIVRWMIVQAVKQKSPEPNAILRKYCKMFHVRDREKLGQLILEAWLSEDIRPIPPDEARNRAEQEARMTHNWIQRDPKNYANSPHFGRSVEEITMIMLPRHMRTPAGSAIGSKGLLAVAAACAGERAAAPVARYLKEWYGSRASQGKALIAMLAWVEHPSAIQFMLSIGSRFRTRSFQEEAVKQAEALAERNNWTLDELADRTIDTAGFDPAGVLDLSYGERNFTAHLGSDLSIELRSPEGKKIASLPEPRSTDDAELAKWAKKILTATKKQLKETVANQTDRLYEALCTERDWPFTEWDAYLNHHPIVRRLVQRLVWAVVDDEKAVQLFRPLEDGTLTDANDEEVAVLPAARVRLAHDWVMKPDEVAQWKQHLIDYEIKPLFSQLGKGTYELPKDRAGDVEIKDFEGHMLETFALRGRALKLGYARGQAEDGGWFYTYVKRFPTLGIEAIISFTGNGLPEENRMIALESLSFYASRGQEIAGLPLAQVPKILLSECYNDLRTLAAEGSGFDPQWRTKAEF